MSWKGLIIVFLVMGLSAFPRQSGSPQQDEIPTKPVGKLTPLQPAQQPRSSCEQLKTESQRKVSNLTKENKALKADAESSRSLAEYLQRADVARIGELEAENATLKDRLAQLHSLLDKQDKLAKELSKLDEDSAKKDRARAIAEGMLLNEVSGTWKIQNGNAGTGGICSVQVNYDSHAIVLWNCRY
jgi:hypothetical protein